jgi:hypothetical protein
MKKYEIISTFESRKPTATIWKIEDGNVIFRTTITNRYKLIPETQPVFFHIPFGEITGTLGNTVKVDDIIQWLVV